MLQDADNDTILATAAMYNRADLIELYIERCPNLPIPSLLDWSNNSEGKTALHLAAMKGHDEPVRVSISLRPLR